MGDSVTDSDSTLLYVPAPTPLDLTLKVRGTTSTLKPVTSDVVVELFMPLVDMDTVTALVVTTAAMYSDDVKEL